MCRPGLITDLEYRIRRHDGEYHWFRTRGVPIRTSRAGSSTGSAPAQTSRITSGWKAALREADRRKNEFLATLAHELRNPLAPIRNGLQVLRLTDDRGGAQRAREMMDTATCATGPARRRSARHQPHQPQRLELRKARIALASVVEQCRRDSPPAHRIEGACPHRDAAPEPVYLDADLTRPAQVFGNLLNNSAKYTDPGGRIELIAQGDGRMVTVKCATTASASRPSIAPHLRHVLAGRPRHRTFAGRPGHRADPGSRPGRDARRER